MKALMTLFWRLAIFRAGPEDTPYSPSILAVVLMIWTGLQLTVGLAQSNVPAALLLGMLRRQCVGVAKRAGAGPGPPPSGGLHANPRRLGTHC